VEGVWGNREVPPAGLGHGVLRIRGFPRRGFGRLLMRGERSRPYHRDMARTKVPPTRVQAPRKRTDSPRRTAGARPAGPVLGSARRLYGAALAVAAVAAAVLILASQISVHRGEHKATAATGITGVAETAALFRGIPQDGTTLGRADAPVTMVEYADLQCPFCGAYARDVLPTIVRDYVRTGKVRLVYRGLAFIGPDSETALRTALAAAPQHKLWNVADLLFRNQGAENAWIDDALLRDVVTAAGAETARVFASRDSASVTRAIEAARGQAAADGVRGTPTFMVGRTGGTLKPLPLTSLDIGAFRAAFEDQLR
jgi:protein-disulfide isomerase